MTIRRWALSAGLNEIRQNDYTKTPVDSLVIVVDAILHWLMFGGAVPEFVLCRQSHKLSAHYTILRARSSVAADLGRCCAGFICLWHEERHQRAAETAT